MLEIFHIAGGEESQTESLHTREGLQGRRHGDREYRGLHLQERQVPDGSVRRVSQEPVVSV